MLADDRTTPIISMLSYLIVRDSWLIGTTNWSRVSLFLIPLQGLEASVSLCVHSFLGL